MGVVANSRVSVVHNMMVWLSWSGDVKLVMIRIFYSNHLSFNTGVYFTPTNAVIHGQWICRICKDCCNYLGLSCIYELHALKIAFIPPTR